MPRASFVRRRGFGAFFVAVSRRFFPPEGPRAGAVDSRCRRRVCGPPRPVGFGSLSCCVRQPRPDRASVHRARVAPTRAPPMGRVCSGCQGAHRYGGAAHSSDSSARSVGELMADPRVQSAWFLGFVLSKARDRQEGRRSAEYKGMGERVRFGTHGRGRGPCRRRGWVDHRVGPAEREGPQPVRTLPTTRATL